MSHLLQLCDFIVLVFHDHISLVVLVVAKAQKDNITLAMRTRALKVTGENDVQR